MPKIVDKEKMKAEILEATVRAFATHGFHNTTMQLIAKEAGIAKGTLYLYFDSKEALSVAFVEGYFAKMEAMMQSHGYAKTLNVFINQIELTLLIDEKEAKFIPIFFEAFGPSFHSKEFRETIENSFDNMGRFYTQNLEALQQDGEVSKEMDIEALGRVLVSMLDGVMLHYGLFNIKREKFETMVKEALSLFRRGLS